jgi:hypothetical protein
LQPIRVEEALGMSLNMGASNAMFTYVKRGVVLIYFIEKGRIEAIQRGNPAL